MQCPDHIKDLTVEEGSLPALAGLLAGFGEEIVAEPEELEGALRRMAAGVRERLGLGAVEISASVGESLRISILEGAWSPREARCSRSFLSVGASSPLES